MAIQGQRAQFGRKALAGLVSHAERAGRKEPEFSSVNDKGLPKKAFIFNYLFWLPDLDSNQGPAD